jgi:hypothetical protein
VRLASPGRSADMATSVPCHVRGPNDLTADGEIRARCGVVAPRSFCWDVGVPYWPRGVFCRSCLRSYRAAGNPHGAVASRRRRKAA